MRVPFQCIEEMSAVADNQFCGGERHSNSFNRVMACIACGEL
jgi:hypothetical protein